MPHAPRDCIDLIYKMCTYDPDERLTARQALKHSYFKELRLVAKDCSCNIVLSREAEILRLEILFMLTLLETRTNQCKYI